MENVEVGSFAESPLKPLRNRLCLLKALGLPLRIEDEEGTVVKNKRTWIFFAIAIASCHCLLLTYLIVLFQFKVSDNFSPNVTDMPEL